MAARFICKASFDNYIVGQQHYLTTYFCSSFAAYGTGQADAECHRFYLSATGPGTGLVVEVCDALEVYPL